MADDRTAALVVALSAQLTKFERDMKQAGDIADRAASGIEKRFADVNPGLSNSFFGNLFSNIATQGLDKALKLVTDLIDRFIDLEKVSKLVGVSMNDIFGHQQAAAKFGVPIEDATSSLKTLAVLVDQMQRGEENSLTKLFDANPEALRGVNRDALTLQQTFEIVANLVQNARTNIQKFDLARAAGQTETMVKYLEQGAQKTTELSKAASASAPDLQKLADSAKAFDAAWKTAVDNIKGYLSENIGSIVKHEVQDLISVLSALQKFIATFQSLPGLGSLAKGSVDELEQTLDGLRKFLSEFDQRRAAAATEKPAPTPSPTAGAGTGQGGTSTRDPNSPLSNVPGADKDKEKPQDSFDRTEEAITRHTASVNADTIAVSQNSAVQAQLRAEFQLLNAIRKDGGEVTQEQIDQYTKLRESMGAQEALVSAGIELNDKHAKSFIGVSEGAGKAAAGYTLAADKVAKLNSASATLGSALSSAFADAIVEGKNLNDVVSSLLKTLEKAAINSMFATVFNPGQGGGICSFGPIARFA